MALKQLVKRLTLTGGWTEFQFPKKSRSFFVKNFSEGDIFVSFKNNDDEAESFKIKTGMGEEVAISFNARYNAEFYANSIFVKGEGEVEVQAMDSFVDYGEETPSESEE